jgi:acyl-coenzyme A thioesterase PaaI-like protein
MNRADADAFLAMGCEVLAAQPFGILMGAQLNPLAPGRCELQVTVAEHLKRQIGFVHGGVLSDLVDNALTDVGGTALSVPLSDAKPGGAA